VIAGTTPGALYDQWSRLLAQTYGQAYSRQADLIVQNMPGAGHMIAANYVYNKSKPDGLTLIGSIVPTLYFDQLVGRKEAQLRLGEFVWIARRCRANHKCICARTRRTRPLKTCARQGAAALRRQGTSDSAYYLPKLFEELIAPSSISSKVIPADRKSIWRSNAVRFIAGLSPSKPSCRGSLITPGARRGLFAILSKPAKSVTAKWEIRRRFGS